MNRRHFALALCSFLTPPVLAQIAGKDYTLLTPPQPGGARGVEVIEFFSFACPHCMQLEPLLQKWRAAQPKDVVLRRVPVGFGRPDWAALARMYVTLGTIGMADKLDEKIFAAIHLGRVNLADEKIREDWLARQGVDLKKYRDSSRSFGVESLMKRTEQLTRDYKVTSVPAIYVDGRFAVQATSFEELLRNTDLLVAKVKAEKK